MVAIRPLKLCSTCVQVSDISQVSSGLFAQRNCAFLVHVVDQIITQCVSVPNMNEAPLHVCLLVICTC